MSEPITYLLLQTAAVKAVEVMIEKVINSSWSKETEESKDIIIALENEWQKSNYLNKHVQHTLKMRTLINPNDDVTLEDVYYPLTIITVSNEDRIVINDDVTINFSGIANIIGIAGQGKSTILRKLFLEEIKKAERIPFFVELRNVEDGDILNYFKNILKSFHISVTPSNVEFLLQSGKVVLLLDGFDEVRNDTIPKIISSIFQLNKTFSCPLITTSRPNTQICLIPGIYNLRVENIELVDKIRILNLIEQRDRNSNGSTFRNLCDLLITRNYFAETICNPIMVTLLYHCFPYMDEVPKDISDFYRQLFGVLYARHDKTKGYNTRERESGIEVEPARALFSHLSLKSLLKEQYELDSFELHKHVTSALKSVGYDITKATAFINDIVKITCLLQADGNDRFVYLHKSVQEFFAAFCISIMQDKEVKNKIYSFLRASILDSIKFDGLVQFLFHLDNISFIEEITLATFKNSRLMIFANSSFDEYSNYFDELLKNGNIRGESSTGSEFISLVTYKPMSQILNLDFLDVISGNGRSIEDMDMAFFDSFDSEIRKSSLVNYSYKTIVPVKPKNQQNTSEEKQNKTEYYEFDLKSYLENIGLYEVYKKMSFDTIVRFHEKVYKVKLKELNEMKGAILDEFDFISDI